MLALLFAIFRNPQRRCGPACRGRAGLAPAWRCCSRAQHSTACVSVISCYRYLFCGLWNLRLADPLIWSARDSVILPLSAPKLWRSRRCSNLSSGSMPPDHTGSAATPAVGQLLCGDPTVLLIRMAVHAWFTWCGADRLTLFAILLGRCWLPFIGPPFASRPIYFCFVSACSMGQSSCASA